MSYTSAVEDTHKEFPQFQLVEKTSSRLMGFLSVLLKIISFNQLSNFMQMTTTVGFTIYTPTQWMELEDVVKEEVVRHEAVHMRQRIQYGIFFYLLYLFLPVPILFAYFRMKFERDAYAETMRFHARTYGVKHITTEQYKHFIVGAITGASYLWPWVLTKQVETWYYTTSALIRLELDGFSG